MIRAMPAIKIVYILLIGLQLSCLSAFAQTRRALVIGLGKQEDTSWSKINGDMDVPIVMDMLARSGYEKKCIITLVNQQATKGRIVNAFNALIRSCQLNDIIYIHFSGHGQRVTDIDGDEEDGWDESWIPYDAYRDYCVWDNGEKHLIDDEIYHFLMEIKRRIGSRGKILVVADACHSGDSSFGLIEFSNNTILPIFNDITIRGISTPFKIPHKSSSKKIKKAEQWLILSACQSFETNQEMNNPHVGILSYALYTISKKESLEMKKIEEFIRLNKGPYPQTPILKGEAEKYKISDVLK